ncbi:RNA-binding protein FUS [Anopheles cruzii]|uniref:RNA-binding protein FUS n=1 Tax=Anopheles cruzii TaxID=68878 RepID=UPI0022EC6BB3|nr:RNA-binding protein FUS [Anopheles cruzii]
MQQIRLVAWTLALLVAQSARANLAGESTVTTATGKLIGGSPSLPASSEPLSFGSLYRSARDEYGAARGRCSNCGPGYERDMRTVGYGRPTANGVTGFYSGMGSILDDRNWYYRPEGYEPSYPSQQAYGGPASNRQPPAYMGGYDYDRYMHRPDDRGYGGYPAMAMRTGYGYPDGGGSGSSSSSRMPYYPDMMMRGYGYRGNGYDNLDPQYEYYMMQRGGSSSGYNMHNRDRNGYYDDRMGNRGYYDQKNFRPWDETYSRPTTSSSPSSSSSQSSPSSAYGHPSYHSQTASAASSSVHTGYGASEGSQQGYRPEQQPHSPDRPDYSRQPTDSNGCRNRYPEQSPAPQNGYHHGSGGSAPYAGQRPSSAPGTWNYLGGGGGSGGTGPISTDQNQHYGGAASAGGSYGGNKDPRPGHHPGGAGSPTNEYGGNRGSEHQGNRETDHRQQR